MTRGDRKACEKLLRHCETLAEIVRQTEDYDTFSSNQFMADSAILHIGHIGEVSRKELSDDFKRSVSGVPWYALYGMRNHLFHDYESVDYPMLWETVTCDIPKFADILRKKLKEDSTAGPVKSLKFT